MSEPTMDDALQRAWRLWYEDPDDKRDLDQIVRDVFFAAPPDRLGPWLVDAVGAAELVAGLVDAGLLVVNSVGFSGKVKSYRVADPRGADRG